MINVCLNLYETKVKKGNILRLKDKIFALLTLKFYLNALLKKIWMKMNFYDNDRGTAILLTISSII